LIDTHVFPNNNNNSTHQSLIRINEFLNSSPVNYYTVSDFVGSGHKLARLASSVADRRSTGPIAERLRNQISDLLHIYCINKTSRLMKCNRIIIYRQSADYGEAHQREHSERFHFDYWAGAAGLNSTIRYDSRDCCSSSSQRVSLIYATP